MPDTLAMSQIQYPSLNGPLRSWSRTFPATPDQVRHARYALATLLDSSPVTADVLTCLSELVTNSIEHSNSRQPGGVLTVHVSHTTGGLRVAVEDQGGEWQQATPSEDNPRGRGLHIVQALADRWGKTGDGDGVRTVWFEMATAITKPPWTRRNDAQQRAMPATEATTPSAAHRQEEETTMPDRSGPRVRPGSRDGTHAW